MNKKNVVRYVVKNVVRYVVTYEIPGEPVLYWTMSPVPYFGTALMDATKFGTRSQAANTYTDLCEDSEYIHIRRRML